MSTNKTSSTGSAMDIRNNFPATGTVEWIGLRPARGEPVIEVDSVEATIEDGLVGDRFNGKPGADRQVSIIQDEHLVCVAELLGSDRIDPKLTRRNLVVKGINLTALKGTEFRIGDVVLQATGACAPCSKMEWQLGPGGYNAMRGHGGVVARVIEAGKIRVGDTVQFLRIVERQKR